MARPSKYTPQLDVIAKKLCELGAINRDLGEAFGVTERTIETWQVQHPTFREACQLNKDIADKRVEVSLYRRATGYTFQAVKIMQHDGAPYSVPYQEHVPPDTVACIFWLKNRKPGEWRDKIDVLATVKPADVSANPLEPDEWDRQYSGAAN